MTTYSITEVEPIYEGWGKLFRLAVRLPDGQIVHREVTDHGSAVAVLPYDADERRAVLVRQFRPPVFLHEQSSNLLEAPAGLLDEDDPFDCARREALEEVGLHLRALEPVAACWASPGSSTERVHLFLARFSAADIVSDGGGAAHEHENIEVVHVPLSDLAALADRGDIADLKTLVLVQALRLRHPALFS